MAVINPTMIEPNQRVYTRNKRKSDRLRNQRKRNGQTGENIIFGTTPLSTFEVEKHGLPLMIGIKKIAQSSRLVTPNILLIEICSK